MLDPKSKLHKGKGVGSSAYFEGKRISPQYFTYKIGHAIPSSGAARINFYPSTMDKILIDDDISYKLLYGRQPTASHPKRTSLTIGELLDYIPGI